MKKFRKVVTSVLMSVLMLQMFAVNSFAASVRVTQDLKPVAVSNYNGHTYAVYDEYMTWEEAESYCESIGGYLVTITSEDEQKAIEDLLFDAERYNYYIGAVNVGRDSGEWEYDGWNWVTGEEWDYTNWDDSAPDNWDDDYYVKLSNIRPSGWVSHKFSWNDIHNLGYIEDDVSGYGSSDGVIGYWRYPEQFGFICEYGDTFDLSVTEKSEDTEESVPENKKDYVEENVSEDNKDEIKESVPEKKPNEISVALNGVYLNMDVAPKLVNGRTMLPVRAVAEGLGAYVLWDEKEEKVTIANHDILIYLHINSSEAYVNGETVILDSPAFIENGRTYTPLRFIAESLGASVDWNQNTQTVFIEK